VRSRCAGIERAAAAALLPRSSIADWSRSIDDEYQTIEDRDRTFVDQFQGVDDDGRRGDAFQA
jgi:hypothetical protein